MNHVWELHLRFRFDNKSPNNFTIWKYGGILTPPFGPVIAAVNILLQAYLLQIPPHEPFGQFCIPNSSTNSQGSATARQARWLNCKTSTLAQLQNKHVRDNTLRLLSCKFAYDDPKHHCRIHVASLPGMCLPCCCITQSLAWEEKIGTADSSCLMLSQCISKLPQRTPPPSLALFLVTSYTADFKSIWNNNKQAVYWGLANHAIS
jgi:hypothetical protein